MQGPLTVQRITPQVNHSLVICLPITQPGGATQTRLEHSTMGSLMSSYLSHVENITACRTSVLVHGCIRRRCCSHVAHPSLSCERSRLGSTSRIYHAALSLEWSQSKPGDGEYVEGLRVQGNASFASNFMVSFAYDYAESRCTRQRSKHGA
jgi:hypothetical protein